MSAISGSQGTICDQKPDLYLTNVLSPASSTTKHVQYSSNDMTNINYTIRLYLIEHYKTNCWPTTAQKDAMIKEILPQANTRARRNGNAVTELTQEITNRVRRISLAPMPAYARA